MSSRIIGVLVGVAAATMVAGGFDGARHASLAQDAGDSDVETVTPTELDLYISVYTAMQADHDLTLDQVLAQKGVTLEQFRNIERRVQKQDRLVKKVRDALTAQAKQRGAQVAPQAAQPPDATVIPPATPGAH
jgi:hypothetical protein